MNDQSVPGKSGTALPPKSLRQNAKGVGNKRPLPMRQDCSLRFPIASASPVPSRTRQAERDVKSLPSLLGINVQILFNSKRPGEKKKNKKQATRREASRGPAGPVRPGTPNAGRGLMRAPRGPGGEAAAESGLR